MLDATKDSFTPTVAICGVKNDRYFYENSRKFNRSKDILPSWSSRKKMIKAILSVVYIKTVQLKIESVYF